MDNDETIEEYEEEINELNEQVLRELRYESLTGFDEEVSNRIKEYRTRIERLNESINYMKKSSR